MFFLAFGTAGLVFEASLGHRNSQVKTVSFLLRNVQARRYLPIEGFLEGLRSGGHCLPSSGIHIAGRANNLAGRLVLRPLRKAAPTLTPTLVFGGDFTDGTAQTRNQAAHQGILLALMGRRAVGALRSRPTHGRGSERQATISASLSERSTDVTLIHHSRLPDVDIPEMAVTDFVFRQAADYPDRLAMTDGAEITYTFGQLEDRTRRFAGGLAERGFGPGSCLALMAPNVPDFFVVFHGVATAGGTLTTINPTYGAEEVRFQLQDANATILVTVPMFVETATEAAEGTAVTDIVVIGGSAETALDAWLGEPMAQVPVDPRSDVMVLPYSSGTTGLPKGVMLTHFNLVANICQMEHIATYEPGEVGLAALPFFHIYGMQVLMNGLVANGAGVVTMPRFDMDLALSLVESYRVTRFYAVPPMVLGLAKSPIVDGYDLSSLKQVFSGAAPLTAELQEEAEARIRCQVVQGYGMTELSPVTHATPEGINRAGTSGLAISNVESRIVDPETGQDQPIGQRGELWVRGPMVMKGYLNNPEATAETIDDDGWLHTGDVAIVDDDGFFSIVDRIKELIKYNGFQVPPAELEGLIVTHPKVLDTAVIGVPDDQAGELPKAFVVVAPGEDLTLEELQAFVAEHLVSYKQIRLMETIDAIPKSASGKILRRELRDR